MAVERHINRRGALSRPGRLFVCVLSVASSYAENVEFDVEPGEAPDTMQWWIGDGESFRIRTFARDHDIHVHRVTQGGDAAVDLAVGNAARTYGEVIASQALIPIESPDSDDAIERALREAGLPPCAEVADRFLFWLADVAEPYRSKSAPVDEAHRRPDPEGPLAGPDAD